MWDFYVAVRLQFPDISLKADKEYVEYWGEAIEEIHSGAAYSWFESLANALNTEMKQGIL